MEKQRWEESEKRKEEERRSEKRKSQKKKKKMEVREKVETLLNNVFFIFFPLSCGSGGSKNKLAKEAGAEPSG